MIHGALDLTMREIQRDLRGAGHICSAPTHAVVVGSSLYDAIMARFNAKSTSRWEIPITIQRAKVVHCSKLREWAYDIIEDPPTG